MFNYLEEAIKNCKQKHKVFISFYHHDDQKYKNYIDKKLSNNIINKSVFVGEYNLKIGFKAYLDTFKVINPRAFEL